MMVVNEHLFGRGVMLPLVSLIVLLLMSGFSSASGSTPAVSACPEITSNGKYWEYRDFLIDAGTGGESGKGKKGLAKGNNHIKGKGVKEALTTYLRKKDGWSTTDHIENIELLTSKLNGFNGGSGILGYVWLEIAKKSVTFYSNDLTPSNELKDNSKIDIQVWGRINESNTSPNTNEAGYAYNANNGSGHVWVTMCFEIRFQGTNDGDPPNAKIRYALKAEVAECGFKAISRGTGTGNAPVFVGSYMPWTANKVPSNFMTKLEAVNFLQGDTPTGYTCPTPPANGYVTTSAVFFDRDGDGNWENWTNNSSFAHLLNPNAEACVDMFFEMTNPPAALPDDARPNYCLGRCSDPPVANSGM